MATTELHKIPDTVLSRSQVYEFRTIPARTVADRLRHIATAESITIPDDALMMLARAGEGSMRDSLSAFDQVLAFAGEQVTTDDVAAVLGLIARDLVLEMLEAVVAEDAPAAFTLTESAITRGYDLRLLCRELSRAMRDLLILSVDPARASDPDIAGEADRDRLVALVPQWSREDLLRGFDLLTRAEQEIRQSEQPRFSMEMALLRLMHLRKLVPLSDLLAGGRLPQATPRAAIAGAAPASVAGSGPSRMASTRAAAPSTRAAQPASSPAASASVPASAPSVSVGADQYRDALLAEIKGAKPIFYNLVVAQAFRIDATAEGVTFTFQPNQKVPRQQAEDNRGWLQDLIERLTGRRLPVTVVVADASQTAVPAASLSATAEAGAVATARAPATSGGAGASPLDHDTVKSVLEMFPVEQTRIDAGS
jgi:DNA polymerase-3 subunit gamma/tau